MDSGNKRGFQLKWPWNWFVCGIFVVGAGYFIGYLWSALLAALFLWIQKKRHLDAVPQGGYCLNRTRKRLARLGWSLLYLGVAFCCGVVFFVQMQEDRSAWKLEEWVMLIVCAILASGAALLCVYETYTCLRDALCPAKSRLAKSIRSQLPYPDEAPDVAELFARVDQDIQENGMWFDRVAIGKEWVLGDEAASIPRIRGVFPRDKIKTHVSTSRSRITRIVQLWLVDDRRQTQCTDLRSPSELEMAVKCLRLRCPEAFFSDYNKLSAFAGKTDEDWQAMERDFRARRDCRLAQEEERKRQGSAPASAIPKPQETIHLTQEAVAEQFAGLKEQLRTAGEPQARGRLTLSDRTGITRDYDSFTHRDVELAGKGLCEGRYTVAALFFGPSYIYLKAGDQTDGRITVNASSLDSDRLRVFETKCTDRQARQWLLELYEGNFTPDFSKWKDITKKLRKQK